MKIRIIPVIFLKNGRLVQSRKFKYHQVVGSPQEILNRFSSWNADEVIIIDISRNKEDLIRSDVNYILSNNFKEMINEVSKHAFMPLTVGGGIRSLNQAEDYLRAGADKICVNSMAIFNLQELEKIIKKYGSQFVVVSIDVKKIDNNYFVYSDFGKKNTKIDVIKHIKNITAIGAGEILLNSIDQDGEGQGLDLDLISLTINKTNLPIIPLGGIGKWQHFEEAIKRFPLTAVAAANIFNHSENSYYNAITYLYKKKCDVRKPKLSTLVIKKI